MSIFWIIADASWNSKQSQFHYALSQVDSISFQCEMNNARP